MRMIYDEKLAQAAYLIGCQKTGQAVIIDPERDVDRYIQLANANSLRITASAETHIHADFISGSRELAEQINAKVYLSDEGDADWKYEWLNKKLDGGTYDHQLLKHGDSFHIGNIQLNALHTPGHTPEHLVFLIIDHGSGATEPIAIVTGDFLFVGDLGRPDLLETAAGHVGNMEPAARRLFHTLRTLDDLPDFIQVWPAHGAGSACGKSLGAVPSSTIGYEKRFNPALRAASTESAFVDFILSGQPEPPLYFANMKRDNKLGPRVLGGVPKPPRLPLETILALDAHTVAIIDTRPWDAFRTGHIPGSLSFPLARSFNTDAGSMVNDTEDIYLIVDHDRLDEAVRDLIRIGLDRIKGWLTPLELANSSNLATIDEISVTDALPLVQSREVGLLDVRRATEFSQGHIPGATNLAHTRIAAHLDKLPAASPILINCRSGFRSARAAAFLKRQGREVINLKGGFLAWQKASAPIDH